MIRLAFSKHHAMPVAAAAALSDPIASPAFLRVVRTWRLCVQDPSATVP